MLKEAAGPEAKKAVGGTTALFQVSPPHTWHGVVNVWDGVVNIWHGVVNIWHGVVDTYTYGLRGFVYTALGFVHTVPRGEKVGGGHHRALPGLTSPRESGTSLPNNQRQHHTLPIQEDVLPDALCSSSTLN